MAGMILDKSKSGFHWNPLFYKVWVHPLQRVVGGEGRAFAIIYLFFRYSSIAAAAFLPAPMARITVAAPVTASPPA